MLDFWLTVVGASACREAVDVRCRHLTGVHACLALRTELPQIILEPESPCIEYKQRRQADQDRGLLGVAVGDKDR